MNRVLVAMSGGVDSAAAALLLLKEGYEVMGATMLLRPDADECDAAREVCQTLGIAHHVIDLREDFRKKVMESFARTYREGRTPNPCIDCNRYFKFGRFFDYARSIGCDGMATGHYARIEKAPGGIFLKKAKSDKKDQSYVLYHLSPEQLSHTLFPLGEYEKEDVRALARSAGFGNSETGESQDICFLPQGDYAGFVEEMAGSSPIGDFVLKDGTVIGQHRGLHRYTVGQRKGLGVAWNHPLYVVAKDAAANRVILGREEDLYCPSLIAHDVNWLVPPAFALPVAARTRYHQKEAEAVVHAMGGDAVTVVFRTPVRAPAAGQAVVFYREDIVLGGGTIG